mmetsp:Transcript_14778/g.42485  ORF Transcript_14778/g.42485 Transcript_14778/m.42485 type:complete len:240 (-) Transcript_14778:151-870(-)
MVSTTATREASSTSSTSAIATKWSPIAASSSSVCGRCSERACSTVARCAGRYSPLPDDSRCRTRTSRPSNTVSSLKCVWLMAWMAAAQSVSLKWCIRRLMRPVKAVTSQSSHQPLSAKIRYRWGRCGSNVLVMSCCARQASVTHTALSVMPSRTHLSATTASVVGSVILPCGPCASPRVAALMSSMAMSMSGRSWLSCHHSLPPDDRQAAAIDIDGALAAFLAHRRNTSCFILRFEGGV